MSFFKLQSLFYLFLLNYSGAFLEYKFSKYTVMIPFIVLASILTSSFLNIVLIWMLPLSPPTPSSFFSLSVSLAIGVSFKFFGVLIHR